MEAHKVDGKLYVQLAAGEELLSSVCAACQHHLMQAATFSGIGTFSVATVVREEDGGRQVQHGWLELLGLDGKVTWEADLFRRTVSAHAVFSYLDGATGILHSLAGELEAATVVTTAEITVEPVKD